MTEPRVTSRPDRIFVSVDTSTGKSTISFFPADCGAPFQREGDKDGALAMRDAKAIVTKYPGTTIHGPHFHAASTGKVRRRGRPRSEPTG